MDASNLQTFTFVKVAWWLIALALPVITLVVLPKDWFLSIKVASATLFAWGISLVYTIYVYNPAGIAAGIELGVESPEMKYDNNTVASTLLGGWFYPLLACLLYLLIKKSLRKLSNVAK